MRQNISLKHRKALEGKICKALKEDIRVLSTDMQGILADDLVTAFFNRLDVLIQVKNNEARRDLTIQCSDDAIEMIHGLPRQG